MPLPALTSNSIVKKEKLNRILREEREKKEISKRKGSQLGS